LATATIATTKMTRTVNLSKRMKTTHMPRRITNSIRLMREEIARHTKTTPDQVKIGGELNRYLMLGAIQGFYGIKVAVEKTGDSVTVDLLEKRKIPVTTPAKAGSKGKDEKAKPGDKKEERTSKADSAKESKEVAKKPKPAPQSTEPTKASGEQGPEKKG